MEASGSLPMSSDDTSSIIDESAFLAATASSIPLRMPVTTTSCIGWSAGGAGVPAGQAPARALPAAAQRVVVTVEVMLGVGRPGARPVAVRFFPQRLPEDP